MINKDNTVPIIAMIGNFDGCHIGHQRIIYEIKSKIQDAVIYCFTFATHPYYYFSTVNENFLIDPDNKNKLLLNYGVKKVINLPFNHEIANMDHRDFIEQIIFANYNVSGIAVGEDFRFGYQRKGNIKFLADYCLSRDKVLLSVNLCDDGLKNKVSSSGIRDLIKQSKFKEVTKLLARPWVITGRVIKGKQQGRTIGFPTANIDNGKQILPQSGVYCGLCKVGGKEYKFVGNCGIRPTFGDNSKQLEIHILNFSGNLYGEKLFITPLYKLRDEKKFGGLCDLTEQIQKDINEAEKLLV